MRNRDYSSPFEGLGLALVVAAVLVVSLVVGVVVFMASIGALSS